MAVNRRGSGGVNTGSRGSRGEDSPGVRVPSDAPLLFVPDDVLDDDFEALVAPSRAQAAPTGRAVGVRGSLGQQPSQLERRIEGVIGARGGAYDPSVNFDVAAWRDPAARREQIRQRWAASGGAQPMAVLRGGDEYVSDPYQYRRETARPRPAVVTASELRPISPDPRNNPWGIDTSIGRRFRTPAIFDADALNPINTTSRRLTSSSSKRQIDLYGIGPYLRNRVPDTETQAQLDAAFADKPPYVPVGDQARWIMDKNLNRLKFVNNPTTEVFLQAANPKQSVVSTPLSLSNRLGETRAYHGSNMPLHRKQERFFYDRLNSGAVNDLQDAINELTQRDWELLERRNSPFMGEVPERFIVQSPIATSTGRTFITETDGSGQSSKSKTSPSVLRVMDLDPTVRRGINSEDKIPENTDAVMSFLRETDINRARLVQEVVDRFTTPVVTVAKVANGIQEGTYRLATAAEKGISTKRKQGENEVYAFQVAADGSEVPLFKVAGNRNILRVGNPGKLDNKAMSELARIFPAPRIQPIVEEQKPETPYLQSVLNGQARVYDGRNPERPLSPELGAHEVAIRLNRLKEGQSIDELPPLLGDSINQAWTDRENAPFWGKAPLIFNPVPAAAALGGSAANDRFMVGYLATEAMPALFHPVYSVRSKAEEFIQEQAMKLQGIDPRGNEMLGIRPLSRNSETARPQDSYSKTSVYSVVDHLAQQGLTADHTPYFFTGSGYDRSARSRLKAAVSQASQQVGRPLEYPEVEQLAASLLSQEAAGAAPSLQQTLTDAYRGAASEFRPPRRAQPRPSADKATTLAFDPTQPEPQDQELLATYFGRADEFLQQFASSAVREEAASQAVGAAWAPREAEVVDSGARQYLVDILEGAGETDRVAEKQFAVDSRLREAQEMGEEIADPLDARALERPGQPPAGLTMDDLRAMGYDPQLLGSVNRGGGPRARAAVEGAQLQVIEALELAALLAPGDLERQRRVVQSILVEGRSPEISSRQSAANEVSRQKLANDIAWANMRDLR